MLLLIECSLAGIAVAFALTVPRLGAGWFEKSEHVLGQFAQRKVLAVIVVGMLTLILRAALLPILPVPEPVVHDEFGYLLAGETYAHGQLTNPSHPMWEHFETFSIIQKPTYQCYAQPAQGMILAAGKILLGHPFWGVWLSAGLMCAAICWMLQGWLEPEWALLGGFLAALRFGTLTYWANSYWGGTAGAIGGALVLGALPRIRKSQRIRDAVIMAVGLAILANSRPYEGFIFSLPVAVVLFAWMFGKERPPFVISLRRVLGPICLLLAITVAGMTYYFWQVTGSPFKVPYQIERETYAIAPYFLWQSAHAEPVYHHAVIRKMYEQDYTIAYAFAHSRMGLLFMPIYKLARIWMFFIGPALSLPLLMMLFILPYNFSWRQISANTRFLLLALCFFFIGLSAEFYFEVHYAAPFAGLMVALIIIAMRKVRQWRPERGSGRFLARAIPVVCVLMFVLRIFAGPLHIPVRRVLTPAWYQLGPKSFGRAAMLADLQRLPGNQLVIVRYQPDHNPFAEWVYNEADIDNAKVVWAHDMSPVENQELISYFHDRQVWLMDADEEPTRLVLYANTEVPIEQLLMEAHERTH
jgi:hypothetical protein